MIKIEAKSLEDAYQEATAHFKCSLTEVTVEVIQYPSRGIFGLFKKPVIIVASKKGPARQKESKQQPKQEQIRQEESKQQPKQEPIKQDLSKQNKLKQENSEQEEIKRPISKKAIKAKASDIHQKHFTDTILPVSFVSGQDDDMDDDLGELYLTPQDDEPDDGLRYEQVAVIIKKEINSLFSNICFDIEPIEVRMYNEDTLLVEFNGEDAALLIGKEGYRYKALSYMIFNWINSKYQLQLRLEIAEFLTNQEDAVSRYLSGVCATIDKQGHAQTKILDGVLIQIALKQLRLSYPDKYISVRTTRDNLKFIIINDYHSQY